MKKFLSVLVGSCLIFLMSSAVGATTWVDTHTPDPTPLYMNANGTNSPHEFTLDLKNDGFDPILFGGANFVLHYTVDLYFSDDYIGGPFSNQPWDVDILWGEEEYVKVSTNFFGFPVEPEIQEIGLFTDVEYASLTGYGALNLLGEMGIIVDASFGDFFFWGAKITASDCDPIPEPTTMILFGLGILGLAGVNRRKK